jgi:hypothetical protein
MIDPKELRLHNLVQANGHVLKVTEIEEKVIVCKMTTGLDWCPQLKMIDPITITPQILETVGFVKLPLDIEVYVLGNVFWNQKEGVSLRINYRNEQRLRCTDFDMLPHIQSLHQLQQLIHDLTQTEIDISKLFV